MEYRIEADGELFPDPHNDAREGDRSVIEFPGYAPPRWLTAPDPGPSQPLHDGARLWSPPGADPRRPLPLLVAHDGSAYEREAQLPRLIAAAIARNAIPPCRIALLDSPRREEDYSASARYARVLAASLPRLAPSHADRGDRREPRRARPAPRPQAPPRRVRRPAPAVGLVLPPALGPPGVGLPPLPPHQPLRRRRPALRPDADADPDHPDLRRARGEPRQQPRRGHRAAAPGPPGGAARDPRRAQLRRLARRARPAISSTCSRGPGGNGPPWRART